MSITSLVLVILGIFVLGVIFIYNSIIVARNRVKEAWSDIDVQLKRRYNLIPNLLETVKGYAAHEKEVFEKVTEARAKALSAQSPKEQAEAENFLSATLKSLFAVVENYPELKANENFLHLQQELVDTEDKIQAARRFYNSNVRDFNIKIQVFPNSIIASLINAKPFEFFEVEKEETETPKVEF